MGSGTSLGGGFGSSWGERRRAQRRKQQMLGLLAVAAVLLAMIPLILSYSALTPVTINVTGKESINTGDGHEYRVYTDKGTFVMKDSIVRPRFNTADEYGRIKVGTVYTCDSFGWRVPLFSMFENLKDCDPVEGT